MIRRVYSGPVRSLSERLGLHPLLQSAYARYKLRSIPNPYSVTLNGMEVRFDISTWEEYRRVSRVASNPELQWILQEIRPDDRYWDVGANIGTHTLFPAKRLTDGSVVAIEPYPPNVDRLERNVTINDLSHVSIEPVALGNSDGEIELTIEGGSPGSGGHSIARSDGVQTVTVPLIDGDSLLETYEPPTVIKMDVQAAELTVLEGMEEALSPPCRTVFCEVHRRRGVDPKDVMAFFEDKGFSPSVENDSGNTVQLSARRTEA